MRSMTPLGIFLASLTVLFVVALGCGRTSPPSNCGKAVSQNAEPRVGTSRGHATNGDNSPPGGAKEVLAADDSTKASPQEPKGAENTAATTTLAQKGPRAWKEITEQDLESLRGVKSEALSILGFHLRMSRAEAETVLKESNRIVGEGDKNNRNRIYVYERLPNGQKGESLLYLIWESDEQELKTITVFQNCGQYLRQNFRRLHTPEALDATSKFTRNFIGTPNRSEVTLSVPQIGLTHTTFYYDAIGIEITRQRHGEKESVVFALSIPPTTTLELDIPESERLFRQLRWQDHKQHFGAALELVKVGKPAVPELVKLINDEHWYVAVTAIWILGEIGNRNAVDPVIDALKSKDRIGPSGYTSYIGDMSFRPQEELSLYSEPGSSPSWNLRLRSRAAAIALGKIRAEKAVESLKDEVLKQGDPEVEVAAAKALKRILGEALPEEIERKLKHWLDQGQR